MSKVGFSRDSRTTSLKEFSPSSSHLSGLCAASITNITVGDADFTNSKSEFWTGAMVPRLSINFKSVLDPEGVKPSYYAVSFMPPAWTPDLLPEGRLSFKIGSEESKLGHILEAIKGSFADVDCWTDEQMAMLTTGLTVVDEANEFVIRTQEEVIAGYRSFYNNIVKIIENGDKPLYNDANGLPKGYFLKLLFTVKGNNVNNGKVGFPNYADTGFIEEIRMVNKQMMPPSIKIQPNKQESIDPSSVGARKAAAPNTPGFVQQSAPVADEAANKVVPIWMQKK